MNADCAAGAGRRARATPAGGNAERQRTGGQQQEKRRQQIPTFHA